MKRDYGCTGEGALRDWTSLACRLNRDDAQPNRRIKRVLVPTDFSPCSARALRYAMDLAREWRATITLLYVVDVNLHTPPTGPADGARLKAGLWKEGAENLGQTVLGQPGEAVEVQTLIREGLPCNEIVQAARGHDLIVIGRHKPLPFGRLFRRRTVNGVLEAASCPVLVIREGENE